MLYETEPYVKNLKKFGGGHEQNFFILAFPTTLLHILPLYMGH